MGDKNATNRRPAMKMGLIASMFGLAMQNNQSPKIQNMSFFDNNRGGGGHGGDSRIDKPSLKVKKSRDRMFKRSRIASRANAKH